MVMRQQVWIDQHVQGVLVGRVLLYWSGILIYFALSSGCFHWWQNPEWTLAEHFWALFDQAWLVGPTLIMLLPLVIFDVVRLSHRFAGPVYRLRQHLRELSQNTQTSPLHFRDDDYWQQLAEPINLLQQKLLVLEQQVQTLSFVHQHLQQGQVPSDVQTPVAAVSPGSQSEAGSQSEFVQGLEQPTDEPSLPPIPPLPAEATETFVTSAAQ